MNSTIILSLFHYKCNDSDKINGIGAFIAYVRPLFDGLATLE
nr:hypothetical protein [uncultured Agathobaculum sp.]